MGAEIGRQDVHAAVGDVEVPGLAVADVAVELQRAILGQHADGVDAGVCAVGKGEINDAVLTAKGNARLCHVLRQRVQARALSAGEEHGNTAFLHSSTLLSSDLIFRFFKGIKTVSYFP